MALSTIPRRVRRVRDAMQRRATPMEVAQAMVEGINSAGSTVTRGARSLGMRSRAERNIAIGSSSASSRAPKRSRPAPRKLTFGDAGGYNQFEARAYKTGAKKAPVKVQRSLVDAVTVAQRLRFQGVSDLKDGFGFYKLGHAYADATYDDYPVYALNLCSVSQGATATGQPLFRLRSNKTTNQLSWGVQSGQNGAGAAGSTWVHEDVAAASTTSRDLGRKSLLAWSNVKLCFAGKKQAPSRIRVQMVKFYKDEVCPEFTTVAADTPANLAAASADGQELWQSFLKPLITNPCSSQVRNKRPGMKVLKTWEILIDPTSTTESDVNPHQKFMKVFNRHDNILDFTAPVAKLTNADLDDPGKFAAAGTGYRCYPQNLRSGIYLIISSMQQNYVASGGSMDNTLTASFDLNVVTCHKTIQMS